MDHGPIKLDAHLPAITGDAPSWTARHARQALALRASPISGVENGGDWWDA
jgi:hypothetical protein